MATKRLLFAPLIFLIASCNNETNRKPVPKEPTATLPPEKSLDTLSKTVSSPDVQDYKDRLHNIVERMNKGFGNVPTTGNPEDDFSKLMITNHFAGIEMCELHLRAGQDTTLKVVAEKKIAFLKRQEDYFDDYQFSSPSGYRPRVKANFPGLKHLEIPNDSDKDAVFAHVLTEYDQNTIAIAKNYLQKSTNASMKKVAQTIIQNFDSELQRLKNYVNIHKTAGR